MNNNGKLNDEVVRCYIDKCKISNNNVNQIYIFDYIYKVILNVVSFDDIVNIIFMTLFRVCTYEGLYELDDEEVDEDKGSEDVKNTYLTENSIKMGKDIADLYVISMYYKDKNKKGIKENYLNKFKDNLFKDDIFCFLNDDSFLVYIGCKLIEIMELCEMLEKSVYRKKYNDKRIILNLSKIVSPLLKKNRVYNLPFRLPIIV